MNYSIPTNVVSSVSVNTKEKMSKKNKICVKELGKYVSVWCPHKTIHEMRMEKDNPHLSFLEKCLDINNYIGIPEYDEMKKRWVETRLFTTDEIDGITYGITYDMKLKIINNNLVCKDLFTMYLNEEETKEEIEFTQTHVNVLKTIPNDRLVE
jgi:predicted esterase YcpF (UPF0227 family)